MFQIDLQTFLTLTDQDLKELGITTFGARRKMLLAISGTNEEEPVGFSSYLLCRPVEKYKGVMWRHYSSEYV